jgi:hypothetical protein
MRTTMRRLLPVFCLLLAASSIAWPESVSIVGGLTREMNLRPGRKSEGKILVRNNSDRPRQVRAYQHDYLFYANGANTYGDPGSVTRSNAAWVSFAPRLLTIPARETVSIHYSVEVPAEEPLTGTYWSVLMVEPVAAETLEPPDLEKERVEVGVRTVLRYAIQFVTHIGRTGVADMKFVDTQLVVQEGQTKLQLDAENTGEKWLRPQVWAEVFDREGMALGRFDGQRLRIYPGCSVRFWVDLSSLPPGEYSALVVADNGDEHAFGARYDLSIQ